MLAILVLFIFLVTQLAHFVAWTCLASNLYNIGQEKISLFATLGEIFSLLSCINYAKQIWSKSHYAPKWANLVIKKRLMLKC